MHFFVVRLPFSPSFLHSVECVVLHCVRAPDEMRSGLVILFDRGRIKISKL